MNEKTIHIIVKHLQDLKNGFWGTFSVRLKNGDPVAIIIEETVKIQDDSQEKLR